LNREPTAAEGELRAKLGVKYEGIGGGIMINEGEKVLDWCDANGPKGRTKAHVAAVNKPLLPVRRLLEHSNRVVFDNAGSYTQNTRTGQLLKMDYAQGV